MSIPGIGLYSALLIKSEICDIDRFPNGNHLCSYAGLVPIERNSGNRIKRGRIKKEGSKWLRWIMIEIAHVHSKYDTSLTRHYKSILYRKGKNIAIVALARELLLCCYSILKHREEFKPFQDQTRS
ncbi:MAG: transposase [Candidatus Methanomethylicaceae archaeon]